MLLNAKLIKESLTKVMPAVPGKSPLPILDNVLMKVKNNVLTFMASNLEIFLESRLEVNIDEEIAVCIEAVRFQKILNTLGDKFFTLTLNEKTATLTCGVIKHELNIEPAEDFPQPTREDHYEYSYEVDSFVTENITKVLPFVNTDELRRNMSGVYFDEGDIVATDGFRLCKVSANCKIDKIIVPMDVAKLFPTFYSPVLSHNDTDMVLENPSLTMYAKLIDDTFPSYKAVIPVPKDDDNELTVNRAELIRAVKGIMLSCDAVTKRITVEIKNEKLILSAHNHETNYYSEDIIDCRSNVESAKVAFNGQYLLDTLAVLKDESVTFTFTEVSRAFVAKNNLVMTLLMPVKVESAPAQPAPAEETEPGIENDEDFKDEVETEIMDEAESNEAITDIEGIGEAETAEAEEKAEEVKVDSGKKSKRNPKGKKERKNRVAA